MITKIANLPIDFDIETKEILKKTISANRALGELKGITNILPNQDILISTLSLQEAKESSEIENIITTHDELYQSDYNNKQFITLASKEVYNYKEALRWGFDTIKDNNILTNNHIIEIQKIIEENNAGFRKIAGTELKNDKTGATIYVPPQSHEEIKSLMQNLELFINDNSICNYDPLVKMAIIHHQFESIHPFYDGNGRTGRIINILYLVKEGLLNLPILYLSRYINQNKSDYYRLLREVQEKNSWEEWILYILNGVEKTSLQTINTINKIDKLMHKFKNIIREKTSIYSHDLINNLFKYPYTKIEFLINDLDIVRNTATKYLDTLVEIKLLDKIKIGNNNYYKNTDLYNLLKNVNNNLV